MSAKRKSRLSNYFDNVFSAGKPASKPIKPGRSTRRPRKSIRKSHKTHRFREGRMDYPNSRNQYLSDGFDNIFSTQSGKGRPRGSRTNKKSKLDKLNYIKSKLDANNSRQSMHIDMMYKHLSSEPVKKKDFVTFIYDRTWNTRSELIVLKLSDLKRIYEQVKHLPIRPKNKTGLETYLARHLGVTKKSLKERLAGGDYMEKLRREYEKVSKKTSKSVI